MRQEAEGALSYPVSVNRLAQKGLTVKIEADERERRALRDFHALEDVKSFVAELQVLPWKKEGVRVKGTVSADIVQQCIVTLEPVEARIETQVDSLFVPENSRLARLPTDDAGELIIDAEGPDVPEPFSGDSLDIGAIAEEFFELEIDPYPRKPGVEEAPAVTLTVGDAEEERAPNAFAGLKDWKQKT